MNVCRFGPQAFNRATNGRIPDASGILTLRNFAHTVNGVWKRSRASWPVYLSSGPVCMSRKYHDSAVTCCRFVPSGILALASFQKQRWMWTALGRMNLNMSKMCAAVENARE